MECIQNDLKKVPSLPSNCSIYRVPKPLFQIKPKAFSPCLVSIGPFCRDIEELQPMEVHKLRYLNNFLEQEPPLCDYVKAMAELEGRARECYSEIILLKSKEFVKMMLLDGCFILKIILQNCEPRPNDPIIYTTWMYPFIMNDLFLLENQLSFFVVERLFNLLGDYGRVGSLTFIEHVQQCFGEYLAVPETTINRSSGLQFWRRKKKDDVESPDKGIEIGKYYEGKCEAKHLLDFIRLGLLPSSSRTHENIEEMTDIRSATELHEAGIKFEKGQTTSLLDVSFSNGVLKIPSIEKINPSLFRNLIAYEQCLHKDSNEITTFAKFMDDLINDPKDAELLQKKGIIASWLGREELSAIYNTLWKGATIYTKKFYLSGVCSQVEKYYKIPWHKWKANLMHNYFNTPWAFMSVFAAVFLLILTLVQTIFSILHK